MKFPRLFIVSVMHTGTTFTTNLLNRWSIGHVHTHSTDNPSGLHIAKFIVSPLRHPQSVWTSFALRGRSTDQFVRSWERLAAFDRKYNILYLPIDRPDRDYYLEVIANAIGTTLTTDWTPAGAFGGPRNETPPMPQLAPNPVIDRFYSEEEKLK